VISWIALCGKDSIHEITRSRTKKDCDAMGKPIEAGAFGGFTGGVALTFATRLLMLVGALGASVIVGRWLGPEGLGALAVLNVTVALAVQIGSAGLPSANTYFISRDRRRLGSAWANTIIFAFVWGALLLLFVVALARINPALFGSVPTNLVVIAAISIPFQLLTLLGLNVLLAMDRIGQMNLLDSTAPVLLLCNAILVLVILHSKLSVLVTFNTAAAFVLATWVTWMIARLLKRQREVVAFRPNAALFKNTMKYGLKFSIPVMAAILIFRFDLLIVNHFRGGAEAGVYAVASQTANLLLMLPGVIATLLFPRVASDPDPQGEFAVRVTRHASFVMLIICVVSIGGSFVLPVIYGARFADAVVQLLILLPGVYLISIESVLMQHFAGTGLPVAIPIFWLITVGVSFGLNLGFVPAFGARGAAVISTVSYALIFGLVASYFQRKTGHSLRRILWLSSAERRELWSILRRTPATRTRG
jgi:O-antigen/teichoic acid export membrane protein